MLSDTVKCSRKWSGVNTVGNQKNARDANSKTLESRASAAVYLLAAIRPSPRFRCVEKAAQPTYAIRPATSSAVSARSRRGALLFPVGRRLARRTYVNFFVEPHALQRRFSPSQLRCRTVCTPSLRYTSLQGGRTTFGSIVSIVILIMRILLLRGRTAFCYPELWPWNP